MKKNIFLVATSVLLTLTICFAQPGSLDSTFGAYGKVKTDIGYSQGGSYFFKHSVAIQSDGKIIVTALYKKPTRADFDFCLVRYKADGSIDKKFGSNGILTTDIGGSEDYARSVLIQKDGKILAAGSTNKSDYGDFVVVRYNKNGTLDSTFGKKGIVTTNILLSDFAYSLAIQDDGKIILAGDTYISGDRDFALVRYSQKGKLDSSFGDNGVAITDFQNSIDNGYNLALQEDGKIILAGLAEIQSVRRFVLLRYLTNGKLDKTFGTNGKVLSDMGNGIYYAPSVVLQANGKILMSGTNYGGASYIFTAAQYLSDGQVDSSFGNNGKIIADFETSINDFARALALQKNGKIVMAGNTRGFESNHDRNWTVLRYRQNGNADSVFGENGNVITDWGGDDAAEAIAIQQDGKIIVAGYSKNNLAVARYNNDTQFVAKRHAFFNSRLQENKSQAQHISLSPNPAKDLLRIEGLSSSSKTISIIDSRGKLLQQVTNSASSASFDVRQLAAGIYFIRIDEGNPRDATHKTVTLKFIKE